MNWFSRDALRRLVNEAPSSKIIEHKLQMLGTSKRAIILFVILAVMVLAVVGNLLYIQVVQFDRFSQAALHNRTTNVWIPPARGLIYDRNGEVLATNKPVYSLEFSTKTLKSNPVEFYATLVTLEALLALNPVQTEAIRGQLSRHPVPAHVVLVADSTDRQRARLAIYQSQIEGLTIKQSLQRIYPYKEIAAHAIGYIGMIGPKDEKSLNPQDYRHISVIGKLGAEKQFESRLKGISGRSLEVIDATGRKMGSLEHVPPKNGENLHLSLDIKLSEYAYRLLGHHRGAVVAINPQTGEILVMVSKPSYDLNQFAKGISQKNYTTLLKELNKPLFDRVTQGRYPPASTLKPMLALGYLGHGVTNPSETIVDPGYFKLKSRLRRYHNWRRSGHGVVNMERAIQVSNDTYFYTMANRAGLAVLQKALSVFGWGHRVTEDVWMERPVPFPTRAYKLKRTGARWFAGDTINMGIGQGLMQATPLGLAAATAFLAVPENPKWLHLEEGISKPWPALPYNDKTLKIIKDGMIKVTHSLGGTAYRAFLGTPYLVAGKTGTAQVAGLPQDMRQFKGFVNPRLFDHGLFIGYAPANKPTIALAVIVENSGGSKAAVPVAKLLFDAYLLGKYRQVNADQLGKNMPRAD